MCAADWVVDEIALGLGPVLGNHRSESDCLVGLFRQWSTELGEKVDGRDAAMVDPSL